SLRRPLHPARVVAPSHDRVGGRRKETVPVRNRIRRVEGVRHATAMARRFAAGGSDPPRDWRRVPRRHARGPGGLVVESTNATGYALRFLGARLRFGGYDRDLLIVRNRRAFHRRWRIHARAAKSAESVGDMALNQCQTPIPKPQFV